MLLNFLYFSLNLFFSMIADARLVALLDGGGPFAMLIDGTMTVSIAGGTSVPTDVTVSERVRVSERENVRGFELECVRE